jgi:hypothetical protein
MTRTFRSQGEMACYQQRKRRIKYWMAWIPMASTILTSLYLLLDAVGVVPMQWEKWLAFILFSFTFFTLAKPTKDVRDVLLDSWRKGVKQKQ